MRAPSPYASFTDIAAMVSRIDPPKDTEGHGRPEFARRQMSWPSGAYNQSFSDSDDSSEVSCNLLEICFENVNQE